MSLPTVPASRILADIQRADAKYLGPVEHAAAAAFAAGIDWLDVLAAISRARKTTPKAITEGAKN